jgi:outer membrane protein assembly factor BamB
MKRHIAIAFCGLLLSTALVSLSAHSSENTDHWPQWRGPAHTGVARGTAPTVWNDKQNIKWKITIPGRGYSTPIIWGDKLFVTTAVPTGKASKEGLTAAPNPNGGFGAGEEHKFMLLCLDRLTGKTLWEHTAKVAVPHEGYHRMYGSFASAAPATDGKYVYVWFGSRGTYCYDFDGKLIWQKDLGVKMNMRNQFGEGGAPGLYGDTLVLTHDQEQNSFVIALDKRNGKELWRASRNEITTWATPLFAEVKGRTQVVTSGTNKVRAYDLSNGKLIWDCAGLGLNAIPSPVLHNDLALVMTGHRDPKLMAIKLGREGDLTGSDAVAWSHTRGLSYTPSPVLHDGKFYALTDSGMLSCFNATTGVPYYHQKRLPTPDNYKASPVAADGKLYLASESGAVTIVKLGEQFEVIAANQLEDQFFIASPVIVAGELYLRSQTQLFCISEKIK